jgi:hypothetical protein
LVILAEARIPPDIQELLVRGDPNQGIKPNALYNCLEALRSSLKEIREENDRLKGERDEIRSAALEEAAKLIEEGYPRPGITNAHGRCPHGLFGWEDCEQCAVAAVRALKAAGEEP